MDFGHNWKGSAGNLSPVFGNNFSFVPPPHHESLYNVRSGPNSLVNLPCCNSPGCSSHPKFSEPYTATNINPNVSYHSPFGPFMGTGNRRRETRHFFPGNSPDGSMFNERQFGSHVSYQSIQMSPNLYKRKLDEKNNFKSNPKRNKQNRLSNTTRLPRRSFSTHSNDNNPQIMYESHIFRNPLPDKNFVNIKQGNGYSLYPATNEPHYTSLKNYPREENMKANMDNTKFLMHNSKGSENVNLTTRVDEHATINSGCQNTTVISSSSNEPEYIRTNLDFDERMASAAVNNFELKNKADQSNNQVTNITVPENSIFNVQDIQQENIENKDLANYFFKSILKGKDENGQDIVILVGDSNTQPIDLVNITNTSTANQIPETTDNYATLTYLTENSTLSSETSLESQVQEVNNDIDKNTFLSHVNDCVSEETGIASKMKYFRDKNPGNASNENIFTNLNQSVEGNSISGNFTSEPSASSQNENNSTNITPNVNPLNAKCNCKCKHFRFRQEMPRWRRRLQWKRNEPFKNMQRAYFSKFLKKVKHENEHMMVSEDFWNMYRMIVTRIGGSVLHTMYSILPALIRNSKKLTERQNDAVSNQSI